jgi:hypothetical protein
MSDLRRGARPRGAPALSCARSSAVASQDHQRGAGMRRRNGRWTMRLSGWGALRGPADRVTSLNSPPCCSLRCPRCSTLRAQVRSRACPGSRGTSVLHRSRHRQPAPACRFGAKSNGGHKPRKRKSRPEAGLHKSDLIICGLSGHPCRL